MEGVVSSENPELQGKNREELQGIIDGKVESTEPKTEEDKPEHTAETKDIANKPVETQNGNDSFTISKKDWDKVNRQLGRFNAVQHKLDMLQRQLATQPKQPETVNQTQEEIEADKALEAYMARKFGLTPEFAKNLQSKVQTIEEMEMEKRAEQEHARVVSEIKGFSSRVADLAGEKWKMLEPIATKLFIDTFDASQEGDPEAEATLKEILLHPRVFLGAVEDIAAKDVSVQAKTAAANRERKVSMVAPDRRASEGPKPEVYDQKWLDSLKGTPEDIKKLKEAMDKGLIKL